MKYRRVTRDDRFLNKAYLDAGLNKLRSSARAALTVLIDLGDLFVGFSLSPPHKSLKLFWADHETMQR